MIAGAKELSENLKWIVTVPLLLVAFTCGMFFQGTNSILIVPCVGGLMALALIVLAPNFEKGWPLPKSATVLSVLLFWLWVTLSHLWSSTPYLSTIFTLIFGMLPFVFLTIVVSEDARKTAYVFFTALLVAACGFAAWALYQFIFMYDVYGPRIHHPMLNPNNLAAVFNMFLLPSVAWFFVAKSRAVFVVSLLATVLLFGGILVTQSRGALLALTISLLVLLPFLAFRKPVPWARIASFAFVLLVVPFVLYFSADQSASHGIAEHLATVSDLENSYSFQNRFLLWASAWEMIKDHFWLGTGLGTFYFYFGRYRNPADISDGFFAHMDPLQFWIELGVLAPILFYAVLICVLLRTVNAVKAAGDNGLLKTEIMGAFAGMLALTLHTHVSYHLYMPPVLIGMAVLMAIWYLATERALDNKSERVLFAPPRMGRHVISGAAFLFVVLVGGWVLRAGVGQVLNDRAEALIQQDRYEEAIETLDQSLIWTPPSSGKPYELQARARIDWLWERIKDEDKSAAKALYDDALNYSLEAEKRNPVMTGIWDYRARLYYIADDVLVEDGREKAKEILHKAVDFYPVALGSRVRLANIYMVDGQLDTAWKVLVDGLHLPRYKGMVEVEYYTTMAMVQAKRGNAEQAKKLVDHANVLKKIYQGRDGS